MNERSCVRNEPMSESTANVGWLRAAKLQEPAINWGYISNEWFLYKKRQFTFTFTFTNYIHATQLSLDSTTNVGWLRAAKLQEPAINWGYISNEWFLYKKRQFTFTFTFTNYIHATQLSLDSTTNYCEHLVHGSRSETSYCFHTTRLDLWRPGHNRSQVQWRYNILVARQTSACLINGLHNFRPCA